MSNNQGPTRLDKIKRWMADNRYISIVIAIGVVVIALGSFTKALLDIQNFLRPWLQGGTATPAATQVYYAVFGTKFPEGAWKAGKTYGYSIDLKECGKDNFNGGLISFDVLAGSKGVPFYLLKDGIYDNADRNVARPANASPFQASYAVVVLPRSSAKAAELVLSTCKAFLNIREGPVLSLDPNPQGAIYAAAGAVKIPEGELQVLSPAPPGLIP